MTDLAERRKRISIPAVRRLSLYLRQLEMLQLHNRRTTSSRQLAETLGLTDAQVRKDLASAGQFGHPGIGYQVNDLIDSLKEILGVNRTWNVVLVGAGNLGRALLSYRGFLKKGFHIVGVFDADPAKIGDCIGPHPVRGMAELEPVMAEHDVRMGILAVPAESAQTVVDRLVAAGVQGLMSFAPVALSVPAEVAVEAVDVAAQMEQLSFRVTAKRLRKDTGAAAPDDSDSAHGEVSSSEVSSSEVSSTLAADESAPSAVEPIRAARADDSADLNGIN